MDRPDADRGELWTSLADLAGVNRWLGGYRSAERRVLGLARRVPTSPVTLLDVGTGGADVPLRLVAGGRAAGVDLRIVASDLHEGTLEFARRAVAAEPAIEVARANALDLPYADASFDIAFSSTTLHHFEPDEARTMLREMNRVARWGVVVTDLARSRSALAGARLLAATVWRRHPITRHDGPASVRAAYTVGEVGQMAAEVFGRGHRVIREPVFRLALVVDRTTG